MFRCPICQETLDVLKIAAVKCGHTFHSSCLSDWLQRSKSCPSCRHPVNDLSQDLIKHLYLEYSSLNSFLSSPSTSLSSEDLETRYIALQSIVAELNDQISKLKAQNQDKCREIDALKRSNGKLEADYTALHSNSVQIKYEMSNLEARIKNADDLIAELNDEASILETQNRDKCGEIDALKRSNCILETDKKVLQNDLNARESEIISLKDQAADRDQLERENRTLENEIVTLERQLECSNMALRKSSQERRRLQHQCEEAINENISLMALKERLNSSNIALSKSNEKIRKLENQSKDAANENEKLSNLVQKLRKEVELSQTRANQLPSKRNSVEISKETPVDDSDSKLGNENDAVGYMPKISANDLEPEVRKVCENRKMAPKSAETIALPPRIPFDQSHSSVVPPGVPIVDDLKPPKKTSKINDENTNEVMKKPAVKRQTKQSAALGGRASPIYTRSKREMAAAAAVRFEIVAKKVEKLENDGGLM